MATDVWTSGFGAAWESTGMSSRRPELRVCSPTECVLPMSHARGGCPFTGREATVEEMKAETRKHRASELIKEWTVAGKWVS
ncbi:hypothetical protein [Streptomyces sp. CC224B]|uniref:hypothetical protein n=1 Tax=Streptomyces sp. CC224B TaxID=3044571 RepID=UPI0024A98A4E|nr:hypothetical protein [Streptomyces sp. CC224B]